MMTVSYFKYTSHYIPGDLNRSKKNRRKTILYK